MNICSIRRYRKRRGAPAGIFRRVLPRTLDLPRARRMRRGSFETARLGILPLDYRPFRSFSGVFKFLELEEVSKATGLQPSREYVEKLR